ncbi:MAG: tRNA glutamyl-Q(34) synthetase GluQRS [Gammaproteobacteria bacterium]|nr:tRNA glutamyl-Q(34) synthetase GluQRS [Gammaproteobacteria bacterium]
MPSPPIPYRGRFAPSPSGALHFGSLIAAVASYLDARCHQGTWLVRMEDVDEGRNQAGAADDILFTLEHYGFEWDEAVIYQTQRKQAYAQAVNHLFEKGLAYRCTCSRRELVAQARTGSFGPIYPGTCRDKHHPVSARHAIRIHTTDTPVEFTDRLMGHQQQNLQRELGDFIIRRRDGFFAYQLAVVVDDEAQQVNQVVRGHDLLDSTARQIYLQRCLGYAESQYLHLPIALNPDGEKLSKQTHAPPISKKSAAPNLYRALKFLGQQPPADLQRDSLGYIWQWSAENWDSNKIPAQSSIDEY